MLKFLLIILTVSSTMIYFSANGQIGISTIGTSSKLRFDTSTTAILELKRTVKWIFDSTCLSARLNQNDLYLIDSFVQKAVNDFNIWQVKNNPDHPWMIDLKKYKYRKQLITVTNRNGEKEVWVNCFCDPPDDTNWKLKLVDVVDGATCYFNFKINLTTKVYYQFVVNSAA